MPDETATFLLALAEPRAHPPGECWALCGPDCTASPPEPAPEPVAEVAEPVPAP